jgi:hypothetical protein
VPDERFGQRKKHARGATVNPKTDLGRQRLPYVSDSSASTVARVSSPEAGAMVNASERLGVELEQRVRPWLRRVVTRQPRAAVKHRSDARYSSSASARTAAAETTASTRLLFRFAVSATSDRR